MKEFGKFKGRYDFSFDSRKLGLVLLSAATISALVFVLGVSVGIQWEKKRAGGSGQPAAAEAPGPEADEGPVAPPVEPPLDAPSPPASGPPADGPATYGPSGGAAPVKSPEADKDEKKEKPAPAAEDLTFPKVLGSNNRKVEPLTPAKKQVPAPAPDAAPAAAPYTVQVGAFNDRATAQSRVDKLNKRGYDARVFVSPDKKDVYIYKVRIGRYNTHEEAAVQARKLEGALQIVPYVTTE